MRTFVQTLAGLAAALLIGCNTSYVNVPPNDIAMILTPTGYDKHIHTPGQVDIGQQDNAGRGNQLVLIQRSGFQIKESFVGADASEDREDHRCVTADHAPMSFDVRLIMALPDYEQAQGAADLERVLMLGNPAPVEGQDRVLRISAQSVYLDQVQQVVRGKIRQICATYANFDAAFASSSDSSENGMQQRITTAVAQALVDQKVPLRVVSAFPSNMKPDTTVVAANAAETAVSSQLAAIKAVVEYLDADRTGNRRLVYELQTIRQIAERANANGHSTIILAPGANSGPITFLNAPRGKESAPAAKPADASAEQPEKK
jgi:hypothetical protein